jgi:hypothetical protein
MTIFVIFLINFLHLALAAVQEFATSLLDRCCEMQRKSSSTHQWPPLSSHPPHSMLFDFLDTRQPIAV